VSLSGDAGPVTLVSAYTLSHFRFKEFRTASAQFDGNTIPGVPEHQVCDLGPCPSCAENDQMSSPCVYDKGHGAQHQCAYGDYWEQADASAAPHPMVVGTPVATAILTYDSSGNMISATGNTTNRTTKRTRQLTTAAPEPPGAGWTTTERAQRS